MFVRTKRREIYARRIPRCGFDVLREPGEFEVALGWWCITISTVRGNPPSCVRRFSWAAVWLIATPLGMFIENVLDLLP